jgi:GDSL-like Lipase/Acylhydrolase family
VAGSGARANLLLALGCTAALLTASEIVLRARFPPAARIFAANVVTRTTTSEYDVEIKTNHEGFRDVDHAPVRPAGVLRIAVIGDSFVFGSGVAFEHILTSRLQSLLSQPGHAVEVFNFGVPGTGPVNALRVWRRIAPKYHPDVVMVALYAGNDAADALREANARPRLVTWSLARALAARWWHAARHRGAATPGGEAVSAPGGGWNAFGVNNPAQFDALLAAGRRRGVSADSVRARYHAIPDSLVADALAFRSNPFNLAEAVLAPDALENNVRLATPDLQRGWQQVEAALHTLREETEKAGARLVLVCIPAGAQVSGRYWWSMRLGERLDARVLTDTAFQNRAGEFAVSENIPMIDLLQPMRDHPDEVLYFEQDGHWTALGHDLAARTIVDVKW